MANGASGTPAWFWSVAGVAVCAASLLAFFSPFQSLSDERIAQEVTRQWNQAIHNYGVEAAYPPAEDIYVGDVYAMVAGSLKGDIMTRALPDRALKLTHKSMDDDLRKEYGAAYQFPAVSEKPSKGEIWPQASAESFAGPGFRSALPVAVLPDFTFTSARAGQLQARLMSGLAAQMGISDAEDKEVTYKLEGLLTYGVSALAAEKKLFDFCDDKVTRAICFDRSLRLQLSNIVGDQIYELCENETTKTKEYCFKVDLAIITRVYMFRRIETNSATSSNASMDIDATAPGSADADAKASAKSQKGSKIWVPPQTVERPVVFGFQTVRMHFQE